MSECDVPLFGKLAIKIMLASEKSDLIYHFSLQKQNKILIDHLLEHLLLSTYGDIK